MNRDLRVLWAVLRKDLRLELRSRERIVVMAAFVVLIGVLAHYSFDPTAGGGREFAVGYLWLTILLAGLVGVGRTFQIESADGGFEGILASPASLGAVYLGKFVANLVLVLITASLAVGVFLLFFGLSVTEGFLWLIPTLGLGCVGFTALATLFAAISTQSRLGESLLPVLLFPLLIPIVIHGVAATNIVVSGRGFSAIGSNVRLLAAEALIAVTVGTLLFRYTVED